MASGGVDYFYRSRFTEKVVDTVRAAGGVLTMEDFDRFVPRWMEPAWGSYLGHKIAGSPPPDNGGTHLIEILNLIDQIPLAQRGIPSDSTEARRVGKEGVRTCSVRCFTLYMNANAATDVQ